LGTIDHYIILYLDTVLINNRRPSTYYRHTIVIHRKKNVFGAIF